MSEQVLQDIERGLYDRAFIDTDGAARLCQMADPPHLSEHTAPLEWTRENRARLAARQIRRWSEWAHEEGVTFSEAFERVLGHEGALSMDPEDNGNWTGGAKGKGELRGSKYGISAASFPDIDIAALTQEHAAAIYEADYWSRLPDVAYPLRFQLFDFAVNSGVSAAVRALQRAVGTPDDGAWGPASQAAYKDLTIEQVVCLLFAQRLELMTRASGWLDFGRGWARRIATNLRYAAEDLG